MMTPYSDNSPPFQVYHLPYGENEFQFGDLYLPTNEGPHPVVMLIHGGFWRARYGLDLHVGIAEDLVHQGMAVWNIEYRRVGNMHGGWPGTLQDVGQAMDYLTKIQSSYMLDLQRSVLIGHSAGGQLVFWLAARHCLPATSPLALRETTHSFLPQAVISLAGVVDLEHAWSLQLGHGAVEDFIGGDPASFPDRYQLASPVHLLPLGVSQILIHGVQDDIVPLEISRVYTQKAIQMGDRVTMIEIDGADHMAMIDPISTAWKMIIQEIKRAQAST